MGYVSKAKAKKERKKIPPWAAPTEVADFLRMTGWFPAPDGWRHKSLRFPWPAADANQLQKEAEAGKQDLVYRMLRGE